MRHTLLIRATHWITFLSFLALAVSGVAILIAHPRFYWGESGYFDTPAAFALPLPVNLDQTGWGRDLHFLGAWIAVTNGVIYVVWGLLAGHFRYSGYDLRQRLAYAGVVFGLMPLTILTGVTMSPAVTAAYPVLFHMFGGRQSARTIHFFAADLLVLFLLVHVTMTIRAGLITSMITGTADAK
ncbi:MAG: cytochrome b/b6 domain-containing protein [Bryobacteraceae bacterium]